MLLRLNFLFLTFFIIKILTSQEYLAPLQINPKLVKLNNNKNKQIFISNNDTLNLPFFDDFSSENFYPDNRLWSDNFVYVNSNYPVNPVTIGVATFDGLDETGYPYNFFSQASNGIADFLTSKAIDLSSPKGEVYLSFYYQPQGFGNDPEPEDSLVLEFFSPADSVWYHQWSIAGSTVQNFKLVNIKVDPYFFQNAFRFRFKNYATLSGNVDHWNIDYVYLNDNRSASDTLFYDISFINPSPSLINTYTSMPWWHFKQDTISNMVNNVTVNLRNLHDTISDLFYKYKILDSAGNQLVLYPSSATFLNNVAAYSLFNITFEVNSAPLNFNFPATNQEVTFFKVMYYIQPVPLDSNRTNDTIVHYQIFHNYYALDDGSAEAAYGVQGNNAKLAYKFDINISDTLRAVQIYFNPVVNDVSQKSFKLTVWKSLNPEIIIYQRKFYYSPKYTNINEFYTYELDTTLLVNGTFYIGWEQLYADVLNIGFDRNIDNSNRIYFNSSGTWQSSQFQGSLMMRPVFRHKRPPLILKRNEKISNATLSIYPNPARNIINYNFLNKNNINGILNIYNVNSKLVFQRKISSTQGQLNLNFLKKGVYFIIFIGDNLTIKKKIIIL